MRFARILNSTWFKFILLAASLFYGGLWSLHPATLLIVAAGVFAISSLSVSALAKSDPGKDKAARLGSLGLGLLFCAMLPISTLTDLDNLYRFAAAMGLPAAITRGINVIENAAITGLTFLFASCVVYSLWGWLRQSRSQIYGPAERGAGKVGSILLYALPCLGVWSAFLYAYWPGILTLDSYIQWAQINHLETLNDWHPVTHTLLEYLLTRLWNTPGVIALFQILVMALAWGAAMRFFETRGLPRKILFLLSCGFALLPYNGIMLVTLMKDQLYTVITFVLVFLLGLVWESGGAWLDRGKGQVLLGLFLGLPFLFRHNGLFVLALVPLALMGLYRQHWKAVLRSSIIAILLVAGIRNGLAFGLLKAEQNNTSMLWVLPIQHISAAGHYGVSYTAEQEAILQRIAPIHYWKSAYTAYNADALTKTWGVLGDSQINDKIEQNKSGLLRTFLAIALEHPGIVARSELDLMNPLWSITFPGVDRAWLYAYSTHSFPTTSDVDPNLPFQPNQSSTLRGILDQYLHASDGPVAYTFIWRGGIYLFLTITLAVVFLFTRGRKALLLFIPSIANLLSLVLAMPMQDFRYYYPIIASTLLLFLFGFIPWQRPIEGKISMHA